MTDRDHRQCVLLNLLLAALEPVGVEEEKGRGNGQ